MKQTLTAAALLGLFIPQLLFAQEVPSTFTGDGVVPTVEVGSATGNVACFDNYHFGSVEANIETSGARAVPGSDVAFSGTLKNTNDYPVVNGTLYLKVFLRDDTTFKAGDGNQLVDQFLLEEKYTIDAKGEKKVEFSWHVPENARGGNYYLATFFATEGRYNLSGLSFTDDVIGNSVEFTVTSDQNTAILLDRTKTTLNGQDHHFVSFPLHFKRDETVDTKVTLTNPSAENKVIQLTWEEYTWDALRKETLQNQKYELIEIGANESKELSYSVTPKNTAVSYLVVTAKDQYSKSVQDIRFVRDGIQETRINFPSLSSFPLKAGEQNSLFACAHSTNLPNVTGNILTLTLRDEDQKTIHEYRYQGDISSAMGGWKDDFTPKETYTKVFLTATLERNGEVVEEVTIPYDCEAINADRCNEGALFGGDNTKSIVISLGLFLTLIAVLAILISRQRNQKRTNRFKALFLALMLGTTFLVPAGVHGATTSWSSGALPTLQASDIVNEFCIANCSNIDIDQWVTMPQKWVPVGSLFNPAMTVDHESNVYNNTTASWLANGATVTVGDNISFIPRGDLNSDIAWFGTGGFGDSPNGTWTSGYPNFSEIERDTLPNFNVDSYAGVSVPPTAPTISHGGTAGLSCPGAGFNCTVTSPGSISSTVTWPSTYATFYYQYNKYNGIANPPSEDWAPGGVNTYAMHTVNCVFTRATPQLGCGGGIYQPSVPNMNITHTLNAIAGNASPAAPSLTGPTSGYTGTSYVFTVQGTDPDGDTVRYYMDWDNNGTGDGSPQPMFGYVASGTPRTFSWTWGTPGTYTIHAQTQDSKGATSGWSAPLTITITTPIAGVCGAANGFLTMNPPSVGLCNAGTPTAVTPGAQPGPYSWSCLGSGGGDAACSAPYLPPAPVVDLLVNGSNGPLAVNTGTNLNITWGAISNATSCTGSGYLWAGGKSMAGGNDNIAMGTASTLYTLTCSGPGGTTSDTVSVAVNAPFVDLKINGSDGPSLSVARNANLNIPWTPITNGVSATGSGNGWVGPKSLAGGSDNIPATVSSDVYTLSSVNGDGVSRTDSIGITLAKTLKICENSCSSGIEPPASFTMVQGSTKVLKACFNDAVSCTDGTGDVTGTVTWSDGGTPPVTIATGLVTAVTSGTEGIRAFDPASSQTVNRVITVTCTDPGACSRDARTINLCQSDAFTVVDACGVTQDCNGTKSCDFNFKEVAP